jgi:GMP synthase-like glutamine amidotransferase
MKPKIAVLDLNNNTPNQGMRCIRELIAQHHERYDSPELSHDEFDVRYKTEVPSLDYDIYISSGGPDSPYVGLGTDWEKKYFDLLDSIVSHNQTAPPEKRKYFFGICYSFQLMARFFELGEVSERKSMSFGIAPVHKTEEGERDWLYQGLPQKFYAADFRNWQFVLPDMPKLEKMGISITCLEKVRDYVPFPRAVMAIRVSEEIIGTQFHPEADSDGMLRHFQNPERKKMVLDRFGSVKYKQIIQRLDDPQKVQLTRDTVLPRFLQHALVRTQHSTWFEPIRNSYEKRTESQSHTASDVIRDSM